MSASTRTDRVSVIIPTYNRPAYLDGAIRTALEQTHPSIEVVVVDDGSETEYAHDIVERFPATVSCVSHDANRGLSAARNTGIGASDGRFVAFLDDDDRWHRDKIADQVDVLRSDRRIGIVTCSGITVNEEGRIMHCEAGAASGDLSDRILCHNVIGSPSRILVRRASLDTRTPFDETLPTKQDWDFYIRVCQRWRVGAVDRHYYLRRSHESMSSDPRDAERDYWAILNKHESLIRSRDCWDTATADLNQRIGVAYLLAGAFGEARRCFRHAFRRRPTGRRLVLLGLTMTTPRIVRHFLSIKRFLTIRRNGCPAVERTAYPGFARPADPTLSST